MPLLAWKGHAIFLSSPNGQIGYLSILGVRPPDFFVETFHCNFTVTGVFVFFSYVIIFWVENFVN
jgi:hypothetical protein